MVCPVNNENLKPTSADPASHEPSQAQPENCASCASGPCARARQPDPTDDHMVMLKELAQLGMRLARLVVVEAEEADARLRAAPEAVPAEPEAEDIETDRPAAPYPTPSSAPPGIRPAWRITA
jgi:hypothetical protein